MVPFGILLIFFVAMLFLSTYYPEEKKIPVKCKYGKYEKFMMEDHQYIYWEYGFKSKLFHDPECQCMKKEAHADL